MQTLKMGFCLVLAMPLLAGCATFGLGKKAEETTLRIYEQSDAALPAETIRTVEIPRANLKLTISPFPTLTEKNVQSAELYDTAGGKAIFLRFDPLGTVGLDELTTRTRGKYVVVMINDNPVSAWLVDQRIINGQFLVEGYFTDEEAKKAVDDLNKLGKKNNSR